MSLAFNRASLKYQLLGGTALHRDQQTHTLSLIDKWWRSYKLWELQDRFLTAFKEGRMTMRQAPLAVTTYGAYNDDVITSDMSVLRGTEGKVKLPGERYRVDIGAMKERMNPANFGLDGGERLKYKKGLHDLSASLGVPTMPLLTKQMRWKPTNTPGKADNWMMVFMPLAQPEDMQLFDLLNGMAKHASQEIKLRVTDMRRRMTRLKFADSVDIGAGLRDIAAIGSDPKLRYGMSSPLSSLGRLSDDDLLRAQKALNYTSILPNPSAPKPTPPPPPPQPQASSGPGGPPPPPPPGAPVKDTNTNEVVIAYREHEGFRFPLFTQYDKTTKNFFCLQGEPSSTSFPNGFIPNDWARAVEV